MMGPLGINGNVQLMRIEEEDSASSLGGCTFTGTTSEKEQNVHLDLP